jgi:hypothetical protein
MGDLLWYTVIITMEKKEILFYFIDVLWFSRVAVCEQLPKGSHLSPVNMGYE